MKKPPLWAQALALSALSDRRFVPAAIALLFALLALRAALEPFGDQDAPWVAAAGREMLASHTIPRTNGWAITDASLPWVMHEWALGPLYAAVASTLGLGGLVALGIVAAGVTTALLAHGTIGASRHLAGGALPCLLAIAGVRECLFQPRPAYVLLGLPLIAVALGLRERFERKHAALFVLLVLVWANVHGSFPLALAILFVGALTHPSDRALRLGTLGVATLATLLNPYGLALHGLVDRYLRGADASAALIHAQIAEFQPLWAAGPVFGGPLRVVPVLVIVVAAAVGILRADRELRGRLLLALATCALAVLHARHVPQAIALSSVLLVPLADRLVDRAELAKTDDAASRMVLRRLLLGIGAITLTLSLVVLARGADADEDLGGADLPALAADARALGRPTYVPFDASGIFVFHALPHGAHVFFDARNDCYAPETITAAVELEQGDCVGACVPATLVEHGVEVAIVPSWHPAYEGLAATTVFVPARTEGDWTLFVRADEPAPAR